MTYRLFSTERVLQPVKLLSNIQVNKFNFAKERFQKMIINLNAQLKKISFF